MASFGNRAAPTTQSFGAFQRYPRNAWYVAAGGVEVTRKPMARKLLDEQVVLYRKENGEPVAMQNHCPHRGYLFSESKVVGNSIQCGYHGMVFNEHGQCTKIAGPGKVPNVMRVKSFPLFEKRYFIWIWMGDPALADPALVPVTPFEDEDGFDHQYYYPLPLAANRQLTTDNLLDATHVSYLHEGLIDDENNLELLSAEKEEKVEGNLIQYRLTMKGFVPNESVSQVWHVPLGRPLTRIITARITLPGSVTITNQFFDPADGDKLISTRVTNIGLTPADMGNSYHFTAVSSSFKQPESDKAAQLQILNQDVFACEAVQRYFEENPETAIEISVPSDKLGIISRRIVDEMVRKESDNPDEAASISLASEAAE